jgi:hypothetical protein
VMSLIKRGDGSAIERPEIRWEGVDDFNDDMAEGGEGKTGLGMAGAAEFKESLVFLEQ